MEITFPSEGVMLIPYYAKNQNVIFDVEVVSNDMIIFVAKRDEDEAIAIVNPSIDEIKDLFAAYGLIGV